MKENDWSRQLDAIADKSGKTGTDLLSVLVIGPNEHRRTDVVIALQGPLCFDPQQTSQYPAFTQIPKLIDMNYDVVIVDLDSNPESALDVVENVCAASQATVMVYSSSASSDLMIRCMRAGAREFLHLPLGSSTVAEALVRASARSTTGRSPKKTDGRLCVFWGAKGGSGVTTIATNFAIAAAQESGERVLLLDLDLPLGDAVLNLGLTPQYSAVDALQSYLRLDTNFLNKLITKHESGISVLAAPGKLVPVPFSIEAIDKLIQVCRQEFDCVVVDSGSRFDLASTALFDPSAYMYLVTQVSIPELRNSNRLATEFFAKAPRFEIILNRHDSSALGLDDEHIGRVITRKPNWRVPNDYSVVRAMQNNAVPLALNESGISRVIRKMARAAFDLPDKPAKKKRFLF
jgi:pilus assembly protein CpaE